MAKLASSLPMRSIFPCSSRFMGWAASKKAKRMLEEPPLIVRTLGMDSIPSRDFDTLAQLRVCGRTNTYTRTCALMSIYNRPSGCRQSLKFTMQQKCHSSSSIKSLRGDRGPGAGVWGIPSPFINLDERGRDTPHPSPLRLMLMRKDFLDGILGFGLVQPGRPRQPEADPDNHDRHHRDRDGGEHVDFGTDAEPHLREHHHRQGAAAGTRCETRDHEGIPRESEGQQPPRQNGRGDDGQGDDEKHLERTGAQIHGSFLEGRIEGRETRI